MPRSRGTVQSGPVVGTLLDAIHSGKKRSFGGMCLLGTNWKPNRKD
jgi:hypothetical protein